MQSFEFPVGLVRFYLRGHVTVDHSLVDLKLPNALLCFIPVGSYKERVPLKNLSSVKSTFSISGGLCVLGLLVGVLGYVTSDWDPGDPSPYLVIGLGILMVVASLRHIVAIEKAGRDVAITMPVYEGGKAKQIVEALTQGMYQDANKTDLGLHGNPGPGQQPPQGWTPQQPPQTPQG